MGDEINIIFSLPDKSTKTWHYEDIVVSLCRSAGMYYPNHDVSLIGYCTMHVISNKSLQWRHNGGDSVSNHQPHECLLNRLFRRRSKKTSKLRVTGLCAGNSPWTGEFPAQMASYAQNVSIWWRHRVTFCHLCLLPIIFQLIGLTRSINW